MMEQLGIREILSKLDIQTPYGRDTLLDLKPFVQRKNNQISMLLNELEEALLWISNSYDIYEDIIYDLMRLKDIRGSLEQLKSNAILDDIELFEIKLFCYYCENIRDKLLSRGFTVQRLIYKSLKPILTILSQNGQITPTFSLYDSYSITLRDTRRKKKHIEDKINSSLGEERRKLLENRLKIVVVEQEEEKQVRLFLTENIMKNFEALQEATKLIGELDVLLAKAKLTKDEGLTKPIIHNNDCIIAKEIIHPIVRDYLIEKGETYTPISLTIKRGTTIITGANMGGKSVAIRTLGLNIYLAHIGCYIYGESLITPILDFVQLLPCEPEGVEKGLSSFGGEIMELNYRLDNLEGKVGLLLLDEFASGTNPVEGRALSRALAKHLHKKEIYAVMVTHFNQVGTKEMTHYQIKGLKYQNLEGVKFGVKAITKRMDYHLEKVTSISKVPREAVTIANLLGLKQDIINEANICLDKEVGNYGEEAEKDD